MTRVTNDIAEAVKWKITPSAYSYEGQLERLEEQIKLQGELIAELIEALYGRTLKAKAVEELLSSYDLQLELDR